jgi:hypothetical protein
MSNNYTKNKSSSPCFETYDLGLTAALITHGYELSSMDKSNPKRVLFTFRQDNKLHEIVGAYDADRLQLKARSYFNNLRAVKNRLHDAS